MDKGPVDIALVGLGFGAEFLPIYLSHPDVGRVGICEANSAKLAEVGDQYAIADRFNDLAEVLASGRYDAVHLFTPVASHHRLTLEVLNSGRHCACAVPMARTLGELDEIVAAERSSGRNYMMMETAVYGREFHYVRDLYRTGNLGELTFLRGVHIQDLDGFPTYWWGYPPMLYATHALSPLLALAGRGVSTVACMGSGTVPDELVRDYDNRFPLETGIFRLADSDLAAEATVAFGRTARTYHEGFSVYGRRMGFEWQQFEDEDPAVFTLGPHPLHRRGGDTTERRVSLPDHAGGLPAEISRFTRPAVFETANGARIDVPSHHSGAHPHLVHEFVRSIVEQRPAAVDAVTAARWCAPGICAHESATNGGTPVTVPEFPRD